MVGLSEASAALSSIKVALELARGVSALRSETEINQAVIDIQRTLLEAQSSVLHELEKRHTLIDRVRELEGKLACVDDWAAQTRRYTLTEFPTGKFAYVLKYNEGNVEPEHKLCAKCFEEKRKSILQTEHKHGGGESVKCLHCKETMILHPFPPVQIDYGRSSWLDR